MLILLLFSLLSIQLYAAQPPLHLPPAINPAFLAFVKQTGAVIPEISKHAVRIAVDTTKKVAQEEVKKSSRIDNLRAIISWASNTSVFALALKAFNTYGQFAPFAMVLVVLGKVKYDTWQIRKTQEVHGQQLTNLEGGVTVLRESNARLEAAVEVVDRKVDMLGQTVRSNHRELRQALLNNRGFLVAIAKRVGMTGYNQALFARYAQGQFQGLSSDIASIQQFQEVQAGRLTEMATSVAQTERNVTDLKTVVIEQGERTKASFVAQGGHLANIQQLQRKYGIKLDQLELRVVEVQDATKKTGDTLDCVATQLGNVQVQVKKIEEKNVERHKEVLDQQNNFEAQLKRLAEVMESQYQDLCRMWKEDRDKLAEHDQEQDEINADIAKKLMEQNILLSRMIQTVSEGSQLEGRALETLRKDREATLASVQEIKEDQKRAFAEQVEKVLFLERRIALLEADIKAIRSTGEDTNRSVQDIAAFVKGIQGHPASCSGPSTGGPSSSSGPSSSCALTWMSSQSEEESSKNEELFRAFSSFRVREADCLWNSSRIDFDQSPMSVGGASSSSSSLALGYKGH